MIPYQLTSLNRWCAWRRTSDGRKRPERIDGSGRGASHADLETLSSYADAAAAYNSTPGRFDGLGLCLSAADAYCAVDLDSCVSGEQVAGWAEAIIARLNSYVELSPSRKGIRIFTEGRLPPGIKCHRSYRLPGFAAMHPEKSAECRVFREGFVTVTGWAFTNSPTVLLSSDALFNLCLEFDRSRIPTVDSTFSTDGHPGNGTKYLPRSIDEAVARLNKVNFRSDECSNNDGATQLYAIVYFMIEKWGYSDAQVQQVVLASHARYPLQAILRATDSSHEIDKRILAVKDHMARKQSSAWLNQPPPFAPLR